MKGRALQLVGRRFGALVVLERAGSTAKRPQRALWRCRCDCGRERTVESNAFRHGAVNCGDHPPDIPQGPTLTAVELAWAAGLFEGEGSVRINKPGHRNLGSLIASVVNTDRQVLDFFQARWPGYMKPASGLRPEQRDAWVWLVATLEAASFLIAIRPYVVRDAVRAKIDHGVSFQEAKRKSRASHTNAYAEEQWNAYWWMAELNRRGRGGLVAVHHRAEVSPEDLA